MTATNTILVMASLFIAGSVYAEQADNPALKRFGSALTFYASFDQGLQADVAKGKPEPTQVDGEPEFRPGLFGRALTMGGTSKHGWYLTYSTLDNVDVTRPGSLALWMSPFDWQRSDEEDYFFPGKIMSNGAQLMFGRQGHQKSSRRTDIVYLWAKLGDSKEILVVGGDSLRWKNGEWHLWVMNWRSRSVEFSLDGGAPLRQDTPIPFKTDGDRSGHLLLAPQPASARYLLDEVIVLNRPLDAEDIKWMYDDGMKHTKP